jgi:hypothetical protein
MPPALSIVGGGLDLVDLVPDLGGARDLSGGGLDVSGSGTCIAVSTAIGGYHLW